MQALILVLEEAACEAGVRLKRLDRKDEKAALQAEQQALDKQLQTEQDPAAELSLAVPLLVQRVRSQLAQFGVEQQGIPKCTRKCHVSMND